MDLESFERILNGRIEPIYRAAHEKVKEMHSEVCIGFYAKNILTKSETELIYFFKQEIVKVKFTVVSGDASYPMEITQNNSKVKRKTISLNRRDSDPLELIIELDDGTLFVFNNREDIYDDDWYQKYGENIISIYKSI